MNSESPKVGGTDVEPVDEHGRSDTGRQTITEIPTAEQKGGFGWLLGTSPVAYSWLKHLFANESSQAKASSWHSDFRAYPSTFAVGVAALVAAVVCHVILPRDISEPPFAVLACSILALIVNGRWGTIAALLYCVLVLMAKIHFHIPPHQMGVLAWNFIMRFLFLEIFVVLFDYIRRRSASELQSKSRLQ